MSVRVAIVDDSPTMRGLIRMALSRHPGLDVVGEAGDPMEARRLIRDTTPDVITLDIEMPGMNGLEFLERLMRLRPMPVVMVSTLTQRGAEASLAALELGAVDCVAKPTTADPAAFDALAARVMAAAGARVSSTPIRRERPAVFPAFDPGDRIVAIGASTGGVEALVALLSGFPPNAPPTVITQHMPANFTSSFAARLDRICAPRVAEAFDGAELTIGQVWLAPGGLAHLAVRRREGRLFCRLLESEPVSGHRPSADVLFRSAAEAAGDRALGVILTGMGRDGAEGLLALRQAGGVTLGQDEATSVVYGMPRAAREIGAVERELPLGRIGPAILAAAARTRKGAA